MTTRTLLRRLLALAPVLALGCGEMTDLDLEVERQTGAAVAACTTPTNPMTAVSSYTGNHGLSTDWVKKYYRAIGRHPNSNCSGVYLGDGRYLSAGYCRYLVNDTVIIGTTYFQVQSILAQKDTADLSYTLVQLNGTADLDLNEGIVRIGNRMPVAGEKVGVIAVNSSGTPMISGGTVVDNNGGTNKFRTTLDTPRPHSNGAPIITEDGYVIGIQWQSTCLPSYGLATMSQKIINDAAPLTSYMRTAPCTGQTKIGNTNWVQHEAGWLRTDVSTAVCGFNAAPAYFTSLGGNVSNELSNGVSSIYDRTATGFRVYVETSITPAQANTWSWHVNWQAFPDVKTAAGLVWNDDVHAYRCAGTTEGTASTWAVSSTTEIYRDVSIPAGCNTVTPRHFFTSLRGTSNMRFATGVSSIYNKASSSFRVYLQRASGITPQQATDWGWQIDWSVSNELGSGRLERVGQTANGSGWFGWSNNGQNMGVYIDVLNIPNWDFPPRYFPSLVSNRSSATIARGVGSVIGAARNGFRYYVYAPSMTAANANLWWRVNWVARP